MNHSWICKKCSSYNDEKLCRARCFVCGAPRPIETILLEKKEKRKERVKRAFNCVKIAYGLIEKPLVAIAVPFLAVLIIAAKPFLLPIRAARSLLTVLFGTNLSQKRKLYWIGLLTVLNILIGCYVVAVVGKDVADLQSNAAFVQERVLANIDRLAKTDFAQAPSNVASKSRDRFSGRTEYVRSSATARFQTAREAFSYVADAAKENGKRLDEQIVQPVAQKTSVKTETFGKTAEELQSKTKERASLLAQRASEIGRRTEKRFR